SAWTETEIKQHAAPGTSFGNFQVPDAPDAAATSPPDLHSAVWRSIWRGIAWSIVALVLLAWFVAISVWEKLLALALLIGGLCLIYPIDAPALPASDPASAQQPQQRLFSAILGAGAIVLLTGLTVFSLGTRRGLRLRSPADLGPLANQPVVIEDRQY